MRFDWNLGENWKLYASYTNQNRQGSRPFGMVFGGGDGGGNVDITESIDYNTHDILAGLQYNDPQSSFNLQLSASLFRNGIDTMTVQNPLYDRDVRHHRRLPRSTFTAGPLRPLPRQRLLQGEGRVRAVAAFAVERPPHRVGRVDALDAERQPDRADRRCR